MVRQAGRRTGRQVGGSTAGSYLDGEIEEEFLGRLSLDRL
jgi:hypothetical protein